MTNLIDGYLQHLRDKGRAEDTREHYAEVLHRMDAEMPCGLENACTEELRDWVQAGDRSNRTRNHYRGIAVGFFKWATDPRHRKLDFNPAELLDVAKVPRRRPRPVGNDLLHLILAKAEMPYRRWFLLAAYAGLRCVELAGLDRSHITEQEIWVRGKGGTDRDIPTHPLIWAEVRDLSGPLVRCVRGGPASRQYVSKRGNEYLHDVLGVATNMHHLRRWFGTAAYAAERDLLAVQELLGHASVATTQIYIDTAAESKASAVALLPVAAA